ncbi:MAG: PAS domain S-box protein [Coriobacteriia bacterium]|nr:PAS domain S-box protein [Coriobacteriia bacterium]
MDPIENDARSLGERAEGGSSSEGFDALFADMPRSLLECRSPDAVFELVAVFMQQVVPDAIVLINEFTEDLEWLITRRVTGLDSTLLEKAEKLAGIKVIGKRSAATRAIREIASGNMLSRVPGGFGELASGEVPAKVAAALARMLGIGDVFTVGISNSEHVFANVHVLIRKPDADIPRAAIESFMHHCCSALSAIRQAQAHVESAEQMALMLDTMVEGLALHQVLLDEDGRVYDYRFLDVNPAYEEMTGLVGADIIGRTVLEVLPGTEPFWIERFGAVAVTGVPDRLEDYSRELDKHFSVVVFSPQPGRFATLLSDVTEKRALEIELEETRDMLVNLADQVPGVVYQYRLFPDGRSCFPYSSAGMKDIYECTPEEVREDAAFIAGRLHPDDLERVSAEIFESAEKLTPYHCEFRVVLPRQGLRWRMCDAVPQRLDDGSTLWYGIITDSTDRVQAHLAQREGAARDATVLKTAMDGFWIAGADGRIAEVNDAYCAMSGYSESELLGMHISDIDVLETPGETAQRIEQIREQGSARFESRHRRKDGTTYPVEISARSIPGSGGQIAAFLRDVTAARMATGVADIRVHLLEADPGRSIEGVMAEALDYICDILESPIGFFHLFDEDRGSLSLTAWSRATTESFCTAAGHNVHYPLESAGIWADAIRERAPVIHNDYSNTPGRKGMPEGHAEVVRELVVPVFRHGKIRAILGVGNKICDYVDADVDAAVSTADMLWQIVERKMVEQELRESEDRFQQLFEKAPLGYQALDGDGRFIEVNAAWLETLGYKREEVVGTWFGDFLAPEYVQVFRERFPVFKAEGRVHSEFYMMHKDGSRRYIVFDGRIGHNADGSFKQTHCILRDDTLRKRAEEELNTNAELLTETERIGRVGGWSFDIDTMEQRWTDEAYRIHEVEISTDPGVAEGINYYTEESRPIIERAVQRAIEHGEDFDLELEILTAKGNTRAVHTIGKADLENRRIHGFFQDITERKRMETELVLQASIIENSPVIAAYHDKDLNVVWVNRAYSEATGLSLEDIRGRKCYQVWNLSKPCRDCPVIRAIETGENATSELTPDTQDHWPESQGCWLSRAAPVRDEQGDVIGAIEFAIDITERKRMEAELIAHRDHLDSLVGERTRDLAQANAELEEATRAKSAFLANTSHELRTPLNSVIGFSGLLLQGLAGPLTEEQQRQVGMINGSGKHLLGLINEILDLTKIESGTVEVFLEEFDLGELLAQLRSAVEPLAVSKGLDLRVDLPPGYHMIDSDRQKLYQIVLNLLGNAVKFTDDGRVNIALLVDENGVFRISVTDTGPGIPQDQLGKLFEPFYQVQSESQGKHQGTGLGLTISHEFAKMLGGTIEVTSTVGKGSVFTLTVPSTSQAHSG